MTKDVASDVATFLENQVVDLTKGTNLFQGGVLPASNIIPINAVFVSSAAGPTPDRSMTENSELKRPDIDIIIRWKSNNAGADIARSIQDAMQAASIPGYQDAFSLQSQPSEIERSQEQDYFWILSFELVYEDAK